MSDIIKSLVLVIGLSAAAGLLLSEFGATFWKAFLFTVLVQIIFWNIYTYYQRAILIRGNQENERLLIENVGKQEVKVPCAACSHEQNQLVELNTANKFECEACKQKNAIYINIETVAMTVIEES